MSFRSYGAGVLSILASFAARVAVPVLVVGCVAAQPEPPAAHTAQRVLLVVGIEEDLDSHDVAMRDRLASQGWAVSTVEDVDVREGATTATDADAFDLVIVSKSVESIDVGDRLKDTTTGLLFWEDNMQMTSMMATIDNDGSEGTTWHASGRSIWIDPEAPEALRAGLEGTVDFYAEPGEITYSPRGQLSDDAIEIARFDEESGRRPIYAYDRDARLADGTRSAGRRVYFGLYDRTFGSLTEDGLALWDAAIDWLAP